MPALTQRLVAIVVLSVAFVAVTIAITGGVFTVLDHQVAETMHGIWRESLHGLFQVIAELGGLEVTTILMAALAVYLWRGGFGADALVVGAFFGSLALELLYKYLLFHPAPPHSLSHSDGPSITEFLFTTGGGGGSSFPSGHIVRTVLVYGILAFVVRRLAPSRAARALAVPAAIAIIVLMAFDRLYLGVHWESDVVGGLLLGGIALLSATVWLDRPIKTHN